MPLFRRNKQSSHGTPDVRTPSPRKQKATPSNGSSTNASSANTSTRTGSSGESVITSNSATNRSAASSRSPPPPPYLIVDQQEYLVTQAVRAYMVFYKKNKASERAYAEGLKACAIRYQPQLESQIKARVDAAIKQWKEEEQARSVQVGGSGG